MNNRHNSQFDRPSGPRKRHMRPKPSKEEVAGLKLLAVLNSLKKITVKIENVSNVIIEYTDKRVEYEKAVVKAIVMNKEDLKTPVAYIISGIAKNVVIKEEKTDYRNTYSSLIEDCF
ncbi:hypothetical protein CWI36_0798p0030 [Hamiltosporidium magnivora]|uniref:Uncharacterized protein n=1 Tax=Hamiltosporidium magnivora TaxID=148818 RepID=A0A4Q9LBH4_9MICR|nr:hypothetical protein CWI36_0798p0030 [Hamiltosporidium magnivora]